STSPPTARCLGPRSRRSCATSPASAAGWRSASTQPTPTSPTAPSSSTPALPSSNNPTSCTDAATTNSAASSTRRSSTPSTSRTTRSQTVSSVNPSANSTPSKVSGPPHPTRRAQTKGPPATRVVLARLQASRSYFVGFIQALVLVSPLWWS